MKTTATEQLDRYIRARYPLIAVISHEENRVFNQIRLVAKARKRRVIVWTITGGMQEVKPINGGAFTPGGEFDADSTREPIAAFEEILKLEDKNDPDAKDNAILFVFKDFHNIINLGGGRFDPIMTRYLRDITAKFSTSYHNIVFLSPSFQIPPDLEKTLAVINWPLPETDELKKILENCEKDLPAKKQNTLEGDRSQIIGAMRGLTAFESESVLLSSIVATDELGDSCIPFIVEEKSQIIKKSGVLEYFDTSVTMDNIGGLTRLKEYAAMKKAAFSERARLAGIDAPKGVLLVGVPGTGKSLSAKAIAGGTMPLLRMDVGSLMAGHVGESESNMSQALKVAEAVAPCVLWIDEIEKALGGVESSAESDGGTLARVFGAFLTWMQETKSPVYVVATANDARGLKPELISRFDDILWVDLPNKEARAAILNIHITKRGYNSCDYELEKIADAVYGYSGREIEKVVKTAIEKAFFLCRPLEQNDFIRAASQIVSINVTMKEKIETLRAWANNRAMPADEPLEMAPKNAAVLEIEDGRRKVTE
jgi:AAA+ superfamily predicted ATPase